MRTARAWGRSLAILSALTLLLTGCLKLDMALTVSPEDTVDGELVFAVNKELLELTGQTVDDFLGGTAVPSDVEGATQEPYEDDKFVGTKVIFESVALAELQQGSDPDSLSIVREGDRFEVTGELDLSTAGEDLQGDPFEGQVTEAFDTAELRIAITFPGEIIETNGQVDGTTVTWEPKFGERTELTAVASASGDGAEAAEGGDGAGASEASGGDSSSGNTLLYVILGLVVIGGLAALYFALRRRGGSTPEAATPAPEAGLPGDTAPPAPPAETSTAPIPPAPVPPAAPPAGSTPEGAAPADTTEPLGGAAGAEPPSDPPEERPGGPSDEAPR
ncbi:MAG: LppM family (lipo)protein [Actinomycetota bacterium]